MRRPPGKDLSALGCLEEVGFLSITNSDKLRSLKGLDRLSVVTGTSSFTEGRVEIALNPALETLAGLDSLREVGSVYVSSNPALTSVSLDHLERVGEFFVGYCAMTSSIALTAEGDNTSLTSIDGFANLQSVGSSRSTARAA